jgi:hypothetical protein
MVVFLVLKHFSSAVFMLRVYFESKAYLRNTDSAEPTAAHQEALVLEVINIIMSKPVGVWQHIPIIIIIIQLVMRNAAEDIAVSFSETGMMEDVEMGALETTAYTKN